VHAGNVCLCARLKSCTRVKCIYTACDMCTFESTEAQQCTTTSIHKKERRRKNAPAGKKRKNPPKNRPIGAASSAPPPPLVSKEACLPKEYAIVASPLELYIQTTKSCRQRDRVGRSVRRSTHVHVACVAARRDHANLTQIRKSQSPSI
jgi:hypothetical protein